MASNETTLTITGNLTGDPELRFTPSGAARTRFVVASTPRLYDQNAGQWKDGEPMFMTCTVWREMAENVAESLRKGTRVVVTGRLRLSKWETPEGEKRQQHQLEVDEVGASLRYAHVQVRKLTRATQPGTTDHNSADAWAPVDSGKDDEPPF